MIGAGQTARAFNPHTKSRREVHLYVFESNQVYRVLGQPRIHGETLFLTKDLGSIPKTHMVAHNPLLSRVLGNTHAVHTDMQTKQSHTVSFCWFFEGCFVYLFACLTGSLALAALNSLYRQLASAS